MVGFMAENGDRLFIVVDYKVKSHKLRLVRRVMKKIALILTAILVAACETTGGGSSDTIEIPASTFDTARENLQNSTVSNSDIIGANFQRVPIYPINTPREIVEKGVIDRGLDITSDAGNELLVLGSTKPHRSRGMTIEIESANVFLYKFENGLLQSGPNIVQPE